jgi:nitric oxide reductase NorD protein
MAISLFEPEEAIGQLWHQVVGTPPGPPHFPKQGASLSSVQTRLGIFFRGLGGAGAVSIKAANETPAHYRLTFRERLGHVRPHFNGLRFDDGNIFLPELLDAFPDVEANQSLYFWLAAFVVAAPEYPAKILDDPLQADIQRLRQAHQTTCETLHRFPGLRGRYEALRTSLLSHRPKRALPEPEAMIEQAVRCLLGEKEHRTQNEFYQLILHPERPISHLKAEDGYRSSMPVILWGEQSRSQPVLPGSSGEQQQSEANNSVDGGSKTYMAKRRNADRAKKKDALIFNRFEAVLSIAEMLNIKRSIDDDSVDAAKKAADDLDELSLVETEKSAKTQIKFDLDLAPQDVEQEALSGKELLPEWDYRHLQYLPDHCQIIHRTADEADPDQPLWTPDAAARKRIRSVARRFEALRPRREILRRQLDGPDLDMDALVRARCDLAAMGEGSDQIFCQARDQTRDLSVAVLFDASRSTESWVKGRQVIDVAREALIALTLGLSASNDAHALFSFSSLRRHRVFVETLKLFDEKAGHTVLSRISALRPGHYTRLGAAVRFVSKQLAKQASERKLVLVITDGKPNDLDHYEGRYGVEDTKRAVNEARAAGQAVFGITVDAKARDYFPFMFGQGGFSILSDPDRLTQALPMIFRHLVT